MAVPYSTRFVQAHTLAGPITHTVPDGEVWIVRDVDAFDDGGATTDLLSVDLLGTIITICQPASISIADRLFSWRGRQVLVAGDTLSVSAISGTWDVLVSGYTLSA